MFGSGVFWIIKNSVLLDLLYFLKIFKSILRLCFCRNSKYSVMCNFLFKVVVFYCKNINAYVVYICYYPCGISVLTIYQRRNFLCIIEILLLWQHIRALIPFRIWFYFYWLQICTLGGSTRPCFSHVLCVSFPAFLFTAFVECVKKRCSFHNSFF